MNWSRIPLLSVGALLVACGGGLTADPRTVDPSTTARPIATTTATTPVTPVTVGTTVAPRVGPIPGSEKVGCTADSGSQAVGEPLVVAGFEARPSLVQRASDPTAPLLVMFHGQYHCVEGLQSDTDLDQLAPAAGVSILWLSGFPLLLRSWNVNGGCCDPASGAGVDELAYVDAAIAAVRATGLTPSSVIAVGVSNGAAMALVAACERPMTFSAVVSVAGWTRSCGRNPLSLLVVGGTNDAGIGGETPASIAKVWRSQVVECPTAPLIEDIGMGTITTWAGCTGGTIVRHVRLVGVGHVWPKLDFYDMDAEIIRFALGEFS